jgi:hypothetical protein
MTKRCKEAECVTFLGKSTHSSWKIRLLLIIFGTYMPFCLIFKIFLSHGHFRPLTLRTIDLSDQWPFGLMNLWTNASGISPMAKPMLVRDSSAVWRLFVRLAGVVGRQSALHKENSGSFPRFVAIRFYFLSETII